MFFEAECQTNDYAALTPFAKVTVMIILVQEQRLLHRGTVSI